MVRGADPTAPPDYTQRMSERQVNYWRWGSAGSGLGRSLEHFFDGLVDLFKFELGVVELLFGGGEAFLVAELVAEEGVF